MKKLRFEYRMTITFDQPVTDHRFTVKCVPETTERQRICDLEIRVLPDHSLSEGRDSFGNRYIYGNSPDPSDRFEIHMKGWADTGLSCMETAEAEHRLGRYRYATSYTMPGESILAYHKNMVPLLADKTDNYDKCVTIMHELYRTMKYQPGVTTLQTTAEEALCQRQGVCQDYAHIMIALCHMENIPARYVVGMLIGEGASHAWVEIYDKGGWYGFDPTNDTIVEADHIKISNGRDYRDCLINQGVFVGNAKQTQEIQVLVEEIQP